MAVKDTKQKQTVGEERAPRRKRVCLYCETKTKPSYSDSVTLRKFLSDRSKIVPRARSGACSKHQRLISREIKYARQLALLPFVNRV